MLQATETNYPTRSSVCLFRLFIVILPCLISCTATRTGTIITPAGSFDKIEWNEDERRRDIAVRTLSVTPEASHHIIRLKTSEKPHTHNNHDLTVFVLEGHAVMHLDQRSTIVRAGDVIEIPRGIVHWAENVYRQPSVVYAIFNPPFDGKDRHFINHGKIQKKE